MKEKITKVWHNSDAEYVYYLHHNKKVNYKSTWVYVDFGNKKWAKRIAKHYGIEVPK